MRPHSLPVGGHNQCCITRQNFNFIESTYVLTIDFNKISGINVILTIGEEMRWQIF